MFDRVTEVRLPLIRKLTNLDKEIVLLVKRFSSEEQVSIAVYFLKYDGSY